MQRWLGLMTVVALLAVACGDDGDGGAQPDPELCALLAQDEPGPEILDRLPSEYRDAAEALLSLGDLDLDLEGGSAGEFADQLLAPGVGDQFTLLADLAGDCEATDAEQALRSYAVMTDLGSVAADDDYCALLVSELGDSNDDDQVPAELLEAAPPAHAEALERIDQLAEEDGIAVGDLFGLLGGLGLYAETRCGGEGLFGTMLFVGAFASAFAGDDGVIDTSGIDPTTEPEPGDPSSANAALPAGAGFSFVSQTVAVEDDGEYLVSAVVPEGWETDGDPFFGITFEPAGGDFDFFSQLSLRAGCDGLCEPTDWQARLEAADGFLTQNRANIDHLVDEALPSGGWLLVADGFAGGVDGTVLRWNDAADRFLVCEFTLGEDDVDYLDAFVAACVAAAPGWFPS